MSIGVTPVKYEWRDGFPAMAGIDPDIAGRELDRIAKRDQEIVPLTLVEESRPADAPLHNAFDWDVTEAAGKWNEHQAKQLIGALKVVFIRNDTEEPLPPVRAFVSVVDEPGLGMYAPRQRHYRPIVKVMSTEDLRDQYRKQAFDALCSWRDRYNDIEDFTRIYEAVDAMRRERAA